jgi:hypothetical protein
LLAKGFAPLFAESSKVLLLRHTRNFTGEQTVMMAFPADASAKEARHEHRE